MKVKLRYYGKLVERIGKSDEILLVDDITVRELLSILEKKYPQLKQLSIKIAQNNRITNIDETITSSKIDVFPPFSGG